jgi:hypothetical protein
MPKVDPKLALHFTLYRLAKQEKLPFESKWVVDYSKAKLEESIKTLKNIHRNVLLRDLFKLYNLSRNYNTIIPILAKQWYLPGSTKNVREEIRRLQEETKVNEEKKLKTHKEKISEQGRFHYYNPEDLAKDPKTATKTYVDYDSKKLGVSRRHVYVDNAHLKHDRNGGQALEELFHSFDRMRPRLGAKVIIFRTDLLYLSSGERQWSPSKSVGYTYQDVMKIGLQTIADGLAKKRTGSPFSDAVMGSDTKYVMTIINTPAGGCETREKTINIDGFKWISPKIAGNNCFFKCINPEAKIPNNKQQNKEYWTKIRSEYNLELNELVSVEKAKEIIEDKELPAFLLVMATQEIWKSTAFQKREEEFHIFKELQHNASALDHDLKDPKDFETKCFGIMLKDNHYHLLKSVPPQSHYCEKCQRSFLIRHKCNENRIEEVKGRKNNLIKIKKIKEYSSTTPYAFVFDYETTSVNGITTPVFVGWGFRGVYHDAEGEKCSEQLLLAMLVAGERVKRDHNRRLETYNSLSKAEKKTFGIKASQYLQAIAYNGSRFDFIPLLHKILEKYPDSKPNIMLQNNAIINGYWWNEDIDYHSSTAFSGIHFFDLAKHLLGTLRSNVISYKCKTTKGVFDYNKIKQIKEMDPKDIADCKAYLKRDVMSLAELFEKANEKAMKEWNVNLTSYISTSHLSFSYFFSAHAGFMRQYKIYAPRTIEEDRFIQQALFGGRTYPSADGFQSKQYEEVIKTIAKIENDFDDLYNGKLTKEQYEKRNKEMEAEICKVYEKVTDYEVYLDANSLYPSAMVGYEYPVGLSRTADHYVPGKLGIYECTYIAPSNLLQPVLPRRDEKGGIHWDLLPGKGVYSSIDIESAKSHGYKVTIGKGMYWEKSAKIFEGFINHCFTQRNLARGKDANGKKIEGAVVDENAADLWKLMMNGLYGKMLQKPHPEKACFIKSNDDFWSFEKDHDVDSFTPINDGTAWISGIPRDSAKLNRAASKPRQLGVFILAYSRVIMRNFIDKCNRDNREECDQDYTDTDSIFIHIREYNKLITQGCVGDGILGKLKDELKGGKIIRSIYLQPKTYHYIYITKKGLKMSFRSKGAPFFPEKTLKEECEHDSSEECENCKHEIAALEYECDHNMADEWIVSQCIHCQQKKKALAKHEKIVAKDFEDMHNIGQCNQCQHGIYDEEHKNHVKVIKMKVMFKRQAIHIDNPFTLKQDNDPSRTINSSQWGGRCFVKTPGRKFGNRYLPWGHQSITHPTHPHDPLEAAALACC